MVSPEFLAKVAYTVSKHINGMREKLGIPKLKVEILKVHNDYYKVYYQDGETKTEYYVCGDEMVEDSGGRYSFDAFNELLKHPEFADIPF